MGKKIAIVQSNYIPWKGYFDLIRAVDEFILYDDAQYTVRGWRNRNRIKTAKGAVWLTIPVQARGKQFQAIKGARVSREGWAREHWTTIHHAYSKAPFFKAYRDVFEPLYLGALSLWLSDINRSLIEAICGVLNIHTVIRCSMDYRVDRRESSTDKLISLCQQAGATEYLSGPSAKAYLDEALFRGAGIGLSYFDYSGYPEYGQLFPPFIHEVSVVDLIFNEGHEAPRYMKSAPATAGKE